MNITKQIAEEFWDGGAVTLKPKLNKQTSVIGDIFDIYCVALNIKPLAALDLVHTEEANRKNTILKHLN